MTDWAVIGHDGQEARVFELRGPTVVQERRAPDTLSALAQIAPPPRILYRIGEGLSDVLPIRLLPQSGHGLAGLSQDRPPDVIDGWVRLLLIGLLRERMHWDGVAWVVLRNLSHWLYLSAGEAISCQSFLTPQLIATLGGTLRPCDEALSASLSRPERLAAHLRAAQVTDDRDALTGHLLGAELAAARPYWLGQSVSLIASAEVSSGYAAALAGLGSPVSAFDPDLLLAPAFAALASALGHAEPPTAS